MYHSVTNEEREPFGVHADHKTRGEVTLLAFGAVQFCVRVSVSVIQTSQHIALSVLGCVLIYNPLPPNKQYQSHDRPMVKF